MEFGYTEEQLMFRDSVCRFALGIAQACLDESGQYSNERQIFGKPINRFQEILLNWPI